jgi:predicted ATP-dependent protease
MVDRGFIFLDTSGAKVGQVNGLSVIPLGDYWFGRPGRITARTYPGKSGVMQIDREAKLTGHIHDKGVLILGGFLNARYGDEAPLALSASITFEQTYDTVDGDSASSTELYAVLSSLADVAIKQSIAVTGSVNQLGEIQPIGGVNEKIEGFFRACKSRGLTGDQGVLIPKANLPHLALDHEVIEAVEAGEFHLYAVSDVDEGMEVLTGLKMGRRGKNGKYPNGTINRKVADTLARYSSAVDGGNGDSSDEDEDGE